MTPLALPLRITHCANAVFVVTANGNVLCEILHEDPSKRDVAAMVIEGVATLLGAAGPSNAGDVPTAPPVVASGSGSDGLVAAGRLTPTEALADLTLACAVYLERRGPEDRVLARRRLEDAAAQALLVLGSVR